MSQTGSDASATNTSDAQILDQIIALVSGRPGLAPVASAAMALAAELGTAEPGTAAPPGEVPDVDLPHVTKPRIDQPLGDPAPGDRPGAPLGGTVPGVIDAELVDDTSIGDTRFDAGTTIDQSIGGGLSAGGGVGQFTDAGVPTWDGVRDKFEQRSGTAMGAEELDRGTQAGRDLDEQWNDRQEAGRKKLEEIRRSMKDG